mgnify:CR=1 FL=1
MDLFNNNVGIFYCIIYSWLTSNNSISSAIMTKLNNGELKYLTPLNINISKGYDVDPQDGIQDCPICLNGIIPQTQLKLTNQ